MRTGYCPWHSGFYPQSHGVWSAASVTRGADVARYRASYRALSSESPSLALAPSALWRQLFRLPRSRPLPKGRSHIEWSSPTLLCAKSSNPTPEPEIDQECVRRVSDIPHLHTQWLSSRKALSLTWSTCQSYGCLTATCSSQARPIKCSWQMRFTSRRNT